MSDPATGIDWLGPLSAGYLHRAALSAVLLGVSGGLIGSILVARRTVLITDSLAHGLLPGVAVAWLIVGSSVTGLFLGGLIAGLIVMVFAGLFGRLTRLHEESAFAALMAVVFAFGLVLLGMLKSQRDVMSLLFSDVLAIAPADLNLAAMVSVVTVVAFALFWRPIVLFTADSAFHRSLGGRTWLVHLGVMTLTVINLVAAMRLVGLVLAMGLFVLPGTTAYLWCERWTTMLATAVAVAVVGALGGLLASAWFDLASGPAMVCGMGMLWLLSILVAPKHGIIARLRPPPATHREVDTDADCQR